MAVVVSVHSFRGGTGKSNITANVAAVLVAAGLRVAVVDTDIQSPGIHVLFGLADTPRPGLNEYLWGNQPITDVAIDVSDRVAAHSPITGSGALYLALVLILRPDRQDFEGTAVTLGVARRLKVPEVWMVCNKVPSGVDLSQFAVDLSKQYDADTVAVLPLSEDLVHNASADLFALLRPEHLWSINVARVAERIRSIKPQGPPG